MFTQNIYISRRAYKFTSKDMTLDLRDFTPRGFSKKFSEKFPVNFIGFTLEGDAKFVHSGTESYNKVILSSRFDNIVCFNCLHTEYIFTSDNEKLIVII